MFLGGGEISRGSNLSIVWRRSPLSGAVAPESQVLQEGVLQFPGGKLSSLVVQDPVEVDGEKYVSSPLNKIFVVKG